jgi:hypothetical protein
MSFLWISRSDDDLQWTWDESDSAIHTDNFRRVYPDRLPRGSVGGREASRATAGTKWSITSGASWDLGDLLRLNDPDSDDYDLRELTSTTETVQAVAAHNIVSGAYPASELETYLGSPFPPVWNVDANQRFSTTDVNSTTPTTAHIGQEAALDNSSGWQLDIGGAGALVVTGIDSSLERFVVRFQAAMIQDNPGS